MCSAQGAAHGAAELNSTANLGELSVENPLPCNDSVYFTELCLSCKLPLPEERAITAWKIQSLKFLPFRPREKCGSFSQ
jgi:hypothetical protein